MSIKKTYLILALLISLVVISGCSTYKAKIQMKEENTNAVHFFYNENCTDCVTEKEFLFELNKEFEFELRMHLIPQNQILWELMTAEHNTTAASIPMTIIGDKVFAGFYEMNGSLEKNPNNAFKGFKNQIENAIRTLN